MKNVESRLRLANLCWNQILVCRGSDSASSWHLLVDVSKTGSIRYVSSHLLLPMILFAMVHDAYDLGQNDQASVGRAGRVLI